MTIVQVTASIIAQASNHVGLNALIAGRIYPEAAPQNPVTPFVIYRRISTVPFRAMGSTIRKQYRFQFDSYDVLKTNAQALDVQLCAAFDFFSDSVIASCLFDGEQEDITALNQNAQLRRVISEFLIIA